MNTLQLGYYASRSQDAVAKLQAQITRELEIVRVGDPMSFESLWLGLGECEEDLLESLTYHDYSLEELEEAEEHCRESDLVLILLDEKITASRMQELTELLPLESTVLWLSLEEQSDLDPESSPKIYEISLYQSGTRLSWILSKFYPKLGLAMAARYSGLRKIFCTRLIRKTSIRNAVTASLSSLPVDKVPVIGKALGMLASSAETMSITLSQLRLCLVLAALHRREPQFWERVTELVPIMGSGLVWRSLARFMLRYIPIGGWLIKAVIAYAGTYIMGESASLYYRHFEGDDEEVLRSYLRHSKDKFIEELPTIIRQLKNDPQLSDKELELVDEMIDGLDQGDDSLAEQ